MAFSNVRKVHVGESLSIIFGDFTATEGAADQTYAFQGRLIYGGVRPNVTGDPVDNRGDLIDTTVSGGITTATIRTESGITAGTFWMLVDGGG